MTFRRSLSTMSWDGVSWRPGQPGLLRLLRTFRCSSLLLFHLPSFRAQAAAGWLWSMFASSGSLWFLLKITGPDWVLTTVLPLSNMGNTLCPVFCVKQCDFCWIKMIKSMQVVDPCACQWLPLQSAMPVTYCLHLTLEHFHSAPQTLSFYPLDVQSSLI